MDAAQDESKDYYDEGTIASQWIVDSDIALTTFQGTAGLTVFARSYATANAMGGVKLTLVAKDNNVVGTVTTDGSGKAEFDAGLIRGKGGDSPVVVMAYGDGGDFSFIDLRRSAFDLTDRGVGGRETPATSTDAYLYTERGVYRGGETVQLTTMIRDRDTLNALSAPLTLVATRVPTTRAKRSGGGGRPPPGRRGDVVAQAQCPRAGTAAGRLQPTSIPRPIQGSDACSSTWPISCRRS